MDIPRKRKTRITCLYAIPLACGLGAFASQVDGQNAPTDPVTCSSTGGTSTSPQAAAMVNQELSERVRAALHAAPYFDDSQVDVTVKGGAVVLNGLVFSGTDLQDALRIARGAAGIRRVVDNLSISDALFIPQSG
jgi:osmotically-inducible protein OsmY